MRAIALVAWGSCLALGCSTPKAVGQRAEDQPDSPFTVADGRWTLPGSLRAKLDAEAMQLPVHDVVLTAIDGAPHVRITATEPPSVRLSELPGAHEVVATLAGDATVECLVSNSRIDVAHLYYGIFTQLVANAPIRDRYMQTVWPAPSTATPMLGLQMEYITTAGIYGKFRMAAGHLRNRGIFCSLDSPGHGATFARFLVELTRSLEASLPEEPVTHAFFEARVDGRLVGLQERIEGTREDGVFVVMDNTSIVLVDGDELHAEDTVDVELSLAGVLVEGRQVRRSDGVMAADLHIEPKEGGSVRVSGNLDGKAVDASLSPHEPLTTTPVRRRMLGELAAQNDGAEHVFLIVQPREGLPTVVRERVSILERLADGARVRAITDGEEGPVESTHDVDAKGVLRKMSLSLGDATLTLERLRTPQKKAAR